MLASQFPKTIKRYRQWTRAIPAPNATIIFEPEDMATRLARLKDEPAALTFDDDRAMMEYLDRRESGTPGDVT